MIRDNDGRSGIAGGRAEKADWDYAPAIVIENVKRADSAVLGLAIIWAAVIAACTLILHGTGYMEKILPVLAGGAGGSIAIIGSRLRGSAD